MSATLWKLKYRMRRSPWLLRISSLILVVLLLYILTITLKWVFLTSSFLIWLVLGVTLGLWCGWKLRAASSNRHPPGRTWRSQRRR